MNTDGSRGPGIRTRVHRARNWLDSEYSTLLFLLVMAAVAVMHPRAAVRDLWSMRRRRP